MFRSSFLFGKRNSDQRKLSGFFLLSKKINQNVGFKVLSLLRLLIFLLLTSYFTVLIASPSGTWEVIHHVPGADWQDVFFLDESHGWAVGDSGGVISTEDGGKNWGILHRKYAEIPRYYACFFVSEREGWIVGYDYNGGVKGVIVYTEDGGKTLEECGDFPGAFFCDVCFASQNEGWVVGGKSNNILILHTENAGEDWEVQEEGGLGYLRKVLLIDEKRGFAVGIMKPNIPLVFQTNDGGKTWNKQSIPISAGAYYEDIFFLNPLEGWIVLSKSLLKTADGGASWQDIPIPENTYLTSAWFKDSNEGVFTGTDTSFPVYSGLIMQTKDGCQTFDGQSGFSMLNAVTCSGGKCWIAGNDNTILYSEDGENWNPQVEMAYRYEDIDFVGKDAGFLLGRSMPDWSPWGDSVIFFTDDGGSNWEEKGVHISEYLSSFDFVDDSSGWIAGAGLYHTEDGGKTIQKEEAVSDRAYDVIFPTRDQGWLACYGSVWRTSDGGETWQETNIGSGIYLLDIEALYQKAWVLGNDSKQGDSIYITEDDGKSFKRVRVEEGLTSISFATEDAGWAAGSHGAILNTEDGGKSWQRQESGTDEVLLDVLFLSEKEGWAVGNHGIILHTTDGGNTWITEESPLQERLNKVVYTGSDYLLAVGDWSTILRYKNKSLSQYSQRFVVSDIELQPITWGAAKSCLYQNYPNPFNPETWIPFSIAEETSVSIRIYNLRGQLVRKIDLGRREPGLYVAREKAVYWDGKNRAGEPVSSGVYYYSISGEGFSEIKKMLLIR